MTLRDAIRAAGMTPPEHIPMGRFVRFPGAEKKRGNTAGWCIQISPTVAAFGDWSTGLSSTWHDTTHVDTTESRQQIEHARALQRRHRAETLQRQQQAAATAREIVRQAKPATHPYLARKGFPAACGLVHEGKLVVPMRDAQQYDQIASAQMIDANGEKRFLPGGRASGTAFRLGAPIASARHIVLCEGYATGLSLQAALQLLPGPSAVLVCFSANNLQTVAQWFPKAVVAADNDHSATGQRAAEATGLRWTMPWDVGTDFNDLHIGKGIYRVVERMRELLAA